MKTIVRVRASTRATGRAIPLWEVVMEVDDETPASVADVLRGDGYDARVISGEVILEVSA